MAPTEKSLIWRCRAGRDSKHKEDFILPAAAVSLGAQQVWKAKFLEGLQVPLPKS